MCGVEVSSQDPFGSQFRHSFRELANVPSLLEKKVLVCYDIITFTHIMGRAMELIDRVAHRLKLRDLRLLETVVRLGSMAKAANRLNISQPAVSKAIAELERVFGVLLVVRNRQGIEPTEYGRALLDCGLAVFDDLRRGVKNIEFLADPTAGEVRIGCNPFLAPAFVSSVVDRVTRRFPRIVVHVMIPQVEIIYQELSERKVDFLITRMWGSNIEHPFEFEFLFEDSFVVVAGVQNPWVRRRKIALAELMNEPWVLPLPERTLGQFTTDAFRACGLDHPHTTVVAPTPEVRLSLLATGRFLSIFPTSSLRFPTRRPELKVLPVELPMAHVPNGIITLKDRALSPVARLFVEHAREVAKLSTKGPKSAIGQN
jgi:DNA-binding transcriptional LysR family regulator